MFKSKSYYKDLIYKVNGAAIEVHKYLGPGLLESIYHESLIIELCKRNILVETEVPIPVMYKDEFLSTHLRCDLIVEKSLIIELKSVKGILPIHEAQLLTYLKLLQFPIGLMINFNCTNIFYEGQKTYVNKYYNYLQE